MKKLFSVFIAAMIVVSAVVIIGLFMIGFIIKNALLSYVPKLTGTEIKISDVHVSFPPPSAGIEKVMIGNPQGFLSASALTVDSLTVDVNGKSLISGDTVIIDRVELDHPQINYEIIGKKDNLRTIIETVKSQANAKKKNAGVQSGPEKSGKKMLIKDFIVKNGKVNLIIPLTAGQSIRASLPEIHLKNVGNKGAPPSEIFAQISNAIYQKVRSPDVTGLLSNTTNNVKTGIDGVSGVIKGVGNELKHIGDRLKGLMEK